MVDVKFVVLITYIYNFVPFWRVDKSSRKSSPPFGVLICCWKKREGLLTHPRPFWRVDKANFKLSSPFGGLINHRVFRRSDIKYFRPLLLDKFWPAIGFGSLSFPFSGFITCRNILNTAYNLDKTQRGKEIYRAPFSRHWTGSIKPPLLVGWGGFQSSKEQWWTCPSEKYKYDLNNLLGRPILSMGWVSVRNEKSLICIRVESWILLNVTSFGLRKKHRCWNKLQLAHNFVTSYEWLKTRPDETVLGSFEREFSWGRENKKQAEWPQKRRKIRSYVQ